MSDNNKITLEEIVQPTEEAWRTKIELCLTRIENRLVKLEWDDAPGLARQKARKESHKIKHISADDEVLKKGMAWLDNEACV